MSIVAQFSGDGISAEVRDDDVSGEITEVEFSGDLSRIAKICLIDGAWEKSVYSVGSQPVSIEAGHQSSDTKLVFRDKT